jgi:hypothetical protein
LYRTQTRREVKFTEPTIRLSAFDRLGPVADENADNGGNVSLHTARRIFSASSLYHPISSVKGIANTLDHVGPHTGSPDFAISSGAPLSTQEILISPRPLGVTHILVVYTTDPPDTASPVDDQATVRRRKGRASPTYPEVAELPINDLLFALNTPNLSCDNSQGFKPILPRRLHKEIPRVLMQVPHLQTFPELVVYLHTKNQAALFRKLIPEWIRDLIHPLPNSIPSPVMSSTPSVGKVAALGPAFFRTFNLSRLLVKLIPPCCSTSSISSVDTIGSAPSSIPTSIKPERSVSSIAAEIGEAALEDACEDAVLHTATLLDALCVNLGYVGYFGKDLWHELDLLRDIMRRAISYQAKVANDPEMGVDTSL